MEQNRIGISSACFYPEETFCAVRHCTDLGITNIEIFMNSFSELTPPYLSRIAEHCQQTNTHITSIHPFTSGYEYLLFFSAYKKRAADSAEFYRMYFHAAAFLGADFVVFHGDAARNPFIGMDNYCEAFYRLQQTAASEGVKIAHENVSGARGGNPAFMRELHTRFGKGNIQFVFDVKQALRGGIRPQEMIDAMAGDICHVHINDWDFPSNTEADGNVSGKSAGCRLPFAGQLDLPAILRQIEATGYAGRYCIEVYRDNFTDDSEIVTAYQKLWQTLLNVD